MNLMHLSGNEDTSEDDFEDEDFYDEEEENRKSFFKKKEVIEEDEEEEEPVNRRSNLKVTPIRQTRKPSSGNSYMEVCIIKPTCMEDEKEITDTLLANRTVVLNLEGIDVEIGQRILDYTSGAIYALDGKLQKISNYIFVCTPHGIGVSGDFQEILSGTYDVPSVSHSVI